MDLETTTAKPAPRLASLGEEARRLCQALLRMDTTNPPGNERICADLLAGELAEVRLPARDPRAGAGPSKPDRAVPR
jgi:hypothetical protein